MQNAQNATRLRDNKRRYRQRQKDYIIDLEKQLAEYRECGVRATQEVQRAAQVVMAENRRLRQLLQHQGIETRIVEAWVQDEAVPRVVQETAAKKSCGGVPRNSCQDLSAATKVRTCGEAKTKGCSNKFKEEVPLSAGGCCGAELSVGGGDTGHPEAERRAMEPRPSEQQHPESDHESQTEYPTPPMDHGNYSEIPRSPEQGSNAGSLGVCKVLTHLASNPRADISQMTVPEGSNITQPEAESDGVECSAAYRMLMQYATTEQKLDSIAVALEEGCVANKGPGGGCRVRNSAVWKALDTVLD